MSDFTLVQGPADDGPADDDPAEEGPSVVGLVMGSDSDWPVMEEAARVLEEFGISYEADVVSAHRMPQEMMEYGQSAADRGLRVIIAGAGGAAHLPGMLASVTPLPVIGVPVPLQHLDGMDSLLSIVQMPAGVPVATVSVGGARNAGLLAARILGANHHAVGLHEVVDGGALLQELGIADNAERVGSLAPDGLAHTRRRSDRHSALVNHDLVAVHGLGDIAGDVEHVRQVGRSVLVLRCADRYEHDAGSPHGTSEILSELQPLFEPVPLDHLLQARLVDGHHAATKLTDLRRVFVDTRHVIAVLCQAGSQHQAHVARPDDRYFHL